MNTAFRKSFVRDLKKIKNAELLIRIRQAIEAVEEAGRFEQVASLKKITGTQDCYSIRVSDYRIGIVLEGSTVDFVRCLPRREMYRYFP